MSFAIRNSIDYFHNYKELPLAKVCPFKHVTPLKACELRPCFKCRSVFYCCQKHRLADAAKHELVCEQKQSRLYPQFKERCKTLIRQYEFYLSKTNSNFLSIISKNGVPSLPSLLIDAQERKKYLSRIDQIEEYMDAHFLLIAHITSLPSQHSAIRNNHFDNPKMVMEQNFYNTLSKWVSLRERELKYQLALGRSLLGRRDLDANLSLKQEKKASNRQTALAAKLVKLNEEHVLRTCYLHQVMKPLSRTQQHPIIGLAQLDMLIKDQQGSIQKA